MPRMFTLKAGIEQRAGAAKTAAHERRWTQRSASTPSTVVTISRCAWAPRRATPASSADAALTCCARELFENVNPVQHQRNDENQRQHHEARANVENCLEFWQIAPETETQT